MLAALEITAGAVTSLVLLLMLVVGSMAVGRELRLMQLKCELPQTPLEDRPYWERIDAAPHLPERWHAYADFLQSQGRTWEAQQIRGKADETKRIRDRKW